MRERPDDAAPSRDQSPSCDRQGAEAAGQQSGGWRSGPRPYILAMAGVLAAAALPWRHGLLAGALRALQTTRVAAAASSSPIPSSSGSATPAPTAPPLAPPAAGTDAPPVTPPAPAPDPRVSRALGTPVHLVAGSGSLWTKLGSLGVRLIWPEGDPPQWSLDERIFNRGLHRLGRRVEHLPRNARLIHDATGFRRLPSQPGRMLDRSAARRQLLALLAQPAFQQSLAEPPASKPAPLLLSLPLHTVPPTVTGVHLGKINTLLAAYSTSLGSSSRNRRHNIRVACEAIDGTVLLPGDVFSYNETVGPRTERAGFRTAPVIVHGELVPGTGGGVCQVSSTLYNVALLADLKIVRRTHHHFPVHYVPPGRDATVAYGSLDLRFANSLPEPVALDVKTVGSRVVVHLYGSAVCKRDVQLVSHRLSAARRRGTPRSASSSEGPGKRVVVTRIVRLPDGSVRREVVSRDSYAPPPPPSHSLSRRAPRSHRSSAHHRPPAARVEAPARNIAINEAAAAQGRG